MRRWLVLLVLALMAWSSGTTRAVAQNAADQNAVTRFSAGGRVRIVTVAFVLPGRLDRLERMARAAGLVLERSYVETAAGPPAALVEGTGLIVIDTPRPNDLAAMNARLGEALRTSRTPWIRVGGGEPAFGNLSPQQAFRLIGYYAAGGQANLAAFFAYAAALGRGGDGESLPAPVPLPAAGFYHPAAAGPFGSFAEYWTWGQGRWPAGAPRLAVVIHRGMISGMETRVVDALVAGAEARGVIPLVFWTGDAGPEALRRQIGEAQPDVLLVATHLQNGPARAAEFLALDVPIIQTVSYREGGIAHWQQAQSGIAQRLVVPFLALPEAWGVSDPMVIDAVEDGELVPIPSQLEALLAKVARLATLRRKPAGEKRLALMIWNYPPGDKNLSASHLNVPRSLERLTAALAQAGYDVPASDEARLIVAMQAMLGAFYDPARLPGLVQQGLAETVPLSRYRAFLDALPAERRRELIARWGQPEGAGGVIDVAGERHFVVPRLLIGKLAVLPQPPRGDRPGAGYHDMREPPSHWYLAVYLHLRSGFGADALIHFGTHGTQEWTPGKDRGLAAGDYPMLAVADLPVFYPYIQDNVGEAIQARRRGRAITISHQTPPFAPAGLYRELNELHARIHEHAQLEDGAVREQTGAEIRRLAAATGLARDMGWGEEAIGRDFSGFLGALHDHLHDLASHVMPLGLHTFGAAAAPEHRLSTIMQQLGRPFYEAAGADPEEVLAGDAATLVQSAPYRLLERHLRGGAPVPDTADPALRAMLERAVALDRHLRETGELEALLGGLAGRFVAPGPGGDPIRNPDVPSGRNLFAFEPDKIPTRAAYEAGETAFRQLLEVHRASHDGADPEKLAFSLWSSEAMRHLGIVESQVMHALGLRPAWDAAGRLVAIDVVPRAELGRPRVDVVLQMTSVYRDQFDGFVRLLAGAIEKIATLDEPDNPVARNSRAIAVRLVAAGETPQRARELAALRIFGNAPGDYGTGLPEQTLRSTSWQSEAPLAEAYLARLQYAYGSRHWGVAAGTNIFAAHLRGVQGAILSRSSRLHGVLSTDHPFEYLGGLALAVRHLDGRSPQLHIADLRSPSGRITSAARFLADEMRARTFNPQWISGLKNEGYAGTVEILNTINNLWGWQVADPSTVRADQWQKVHEIFVRDSLNLDLAGWFERHNPTAQAQIIERMVEAIRKGYWDAPDETRRELAARWHALADTHGVGIGEAVTRAFVAEMGTAGFGAASADHGASRDAAAAEPVRGQELRPVVRRPLEPWPLAAMAGVALLVLSTLTGAWMQLRAGATQHCQRKHA